jgi:protein-tyrosine phosphatase
MKPKRILFVCLGNICRSPAAEGVLRHFAQKQGVNDLVEIDSAGTLGLHHGKPADARMRAAASSRGIELTSRARQVDRRDVDAFDRIIVMDRQNYRDLMALVSGVPNHIRMLSDYLQGEWPRDVPDPYTRGLESFEFVLDMLQAAAPRIIEDVVGLTPSRPDRDVP